MPERRKFRGKRVKKTRKFISQTNKEMIRITFCGPANVPGEQLTVGLSEYEADVERFFEQGKAK